MVHKGSPIAPSRYWQYLQKCLHSGDFASVRLGMTREEVRARLGEPDDTGGALRKQRIPLVWKYGEVELHFQPSGELFLIYWDDFGDGLFHSIAITEKGSEVRSEPEISGE